MVHYSLFVTGVAVLAIFAAVTLWYKFRAAGWTFDSLHKATQDLETAKRHKQEVDSATVKAQEEYDNLCGRLNQVNNDLSAAEERQKSASLLASKELELQNERLKMQYQSKLDTELEEMRSSHPLTTHRAILEDLQKQIAEAKKILSIHHEEVKAAEEEEDFNAAHSLPLTIPDQQDIALLREFAPRIARKDAINKLIWSEWYQRPLQTLRKSLKADKVTGIYMIKECCTGRMYIGQAMNIGERWAEHVKAALGINSSAYLSNKFYSAMHKRGPENFTFQILEVCAPEELNTKEKYWIDFYDAVSFGFNTKAGGQ